MYSYDVMSNDRIFRLIKHGKHAFLGVAAQDKPYIVPMYFSYGFLNGQLIIYMESTLRGRKLEYIVKNPNVCVAIEGSSELGMESVVLSGHARVYKSGEGALEVNRIEITVHEFSGRLYKHCRL